MSSVLTNKARKYITRLFDRATVLQNQIDSNNLQDYSDHKAEQSALLWAIDKLEHDPTNFREL